jgi:P-type Cu+ transporter
MQTAKEKSVVDPVCGMSVDPSTAAGSFEFGGTTYFFCNPHCQRKFSASPEQFLQQPVTAGHAVPIGIQARQSRVLNKQSFTCPMHLEVVQTTPGACPKCGMALDPATPFTATERTEYTCPMHPEIVREAPGSCPICGMALEPRVIALEDAENPELTDMRRRFWVCAALTVPVFVIGMSDLIPGAPLQRLAPQSVWTWIQLLMATPVVVWGGWPFFCAPGPSSFIANATSSP